MRMLPHNPASNLALHVRGYAALLDLQSVTTRQLDAPERTDALSPTGSSALAMWPGCRLLYFSFLGSCVPDSSRAALRALMSSSLRFIVTSKLALVTR